MIGQHRHLRGLSLTIAFVHVALVALDAIRRSAFQWPPSSTLAAAVGDSDLWYAGHGAAAVLIVVSVARPDARFAYIAHTLLSAPVLAAWSLCALWWALTLPTPVSLVGSTISGVCAVQSGILSKAWDALNDCSRRGEG